MQKDIIIRLRVSASNRKKYKDAAKKAKKTLSAWMRESMDLHVIWQPLEVMRCVSIPITEESNQFNPQDDIIIKGKLPKISKKLQKELIKDSIKVLATTTKSHKPFKSRLKGEWKP